MAKKKLKKVKPSTTLAKDIMSTSLVVVRKENTFRTAVELLTKNRVTILPVINKVGKLIGLLTEREILQACEHYDQAVPDFLDLPIRYNKQVRTIDIDTPINEVGMILANETFRHLPVVDKNKILYGIITRRDLIRVIYLRIELSKGIAS